MRRMMRSKKRTETLLGSITQTKVVIPSNLRRSRKLMTCCPTRINGETLINLEIRMGCLRALQVVSQVDFLQIFLPICLVVVSGDQSDVQITNTSSTYHSRMRTEASPKTSGSELPALVSTA